MVELEKKMMEGEQWITSFEFICVKGQTVSVNFIKTEY